MSTVAELIQRNHDSIVEAWSGPAEKAASARGLDRPQFLNVLPLYLDRLGKRTGDAAAERSKALEEHFGSRLEQGFQVAEIVDEIVLLGRCIIASWDGLPRSEQPAA